MFGCWQDPNKVEDKTNPSADKFLSKVIPLIQNARRATYVWIYGFYCTMSIPAAFART